MAYHEGAESSGVSHNFNTFRINNNNYCPNQYDFVAMSHMQIGVPASQSMCPFFYKYVDVSLIITTLSFTNYAPI